MLDQVLAPALIVIVGVLGFLLRGFFGSYVGEKGKNLATKQDIEQITAQVESVKASIQTLSTLRTDYEQQRREWLLSFYDSAVEMLYEKLSASFGDMPYDDGRTLFELQQSFSALFVTLLKQYQRIVVYFEHGSALRQSAEAIVISGVQAQSVLKKRFGDVKMALADEYQAVLSGDDARFREAAGRSDQVVRAYLADMNPVAQVFREQLPAYLTNLNIFLGGDGS